MIGDYKSLHVWQKSMDLVVAVYRITKQYPESEKYGLVSQINRSAVSIPSNIAGGKLRGGDVEFRIFLFVAFASGGELETQIEISKRLPETEKIDYSTVDILLEEVMKMLNKLIITLEARA